MARQSRHDPLPPFLLTRPEAQGDRFADQLRARFGAETEIRSSPLIAPRFIATQLPDSVYSGLIFTSETGVAAFRQISADIRLPAWCVGDRTAAAARAAGLAAISASGDAAALAEAIRRSAMPGPFLHLRGQDTRGELADTLNFNGITTHEAVVYAQDAQPLNDVAVRLLRGTGPVIAPLFSPRTAKLFAAEAARLAVTAPIWVAALSPAVAREAAAAAPARLATAVQPDAEALLDAIECLLAAPSQP